MGSILTLLFVAIGGSISDGGLIRVLNGVTQADLKGTLAAFRTTLIPEGAVVAFDTPNGCPEGWSELSDAVGKMIIGAGREGDTYLYRVPGGKEYINLTEQHIPAHVHEYTDAYFSEVDHRRPRGSESVTVPGSKGLRGDVDENNVGWAVTRKTGSFGYEEANRIRHTNMQPYIPLYLCVFKPSGLSGNEADS